MLSALEIIMCAHVQAFYFYIFFYTFLLCFTGILLMMWLCEKVNVYEYIPSLRQTDLCHYHERYYDAACTLGAYHPLLYEKKLIQRISYKSKSDLQKKGKVTLQGFRTIYCNP